MITIQQPDIQNIIIKSKYLQEKLQIQRQVWVNNELLRIPKILTLKQHKITLSSPIQATTLCQHHLDILILSSPPQTNHTTDYK
jgi:hypothetical protein